MTQRFSGLLLLACLLLPGCIAQYRPQSGPPCQLVEALDNCGTYDLLRGPENSYLLGIAEFDDQGEPWSPAQINSLVPRISQTVGNRPLLVVVFAHGWFHDADARDSNLLIFNQLLGYLQQQEGVYARDSRKPEATTGGNTPRQVVGIYLGWRGESVSFPGLKYLSFWGRKKAAQKIGRRGALELLLPLEKLVRSRNLADPEFAPEPGESQLLLIGHSFGGALLYSALANIMVQHHFESGPETGFGDQIVLLNPAIEAQQFANLRRIFRQEGGDSGVQAARLVILASETDWPMGIFFPFGRGFSTWLERHREDQRSANTHGIGHYQPFNTHYVHALPVEEKVVDICDQPAADQFRWLLLQTSPADADDCRTGELVGERFCFRATGNYPFGSLLIAQTSSDIMDGHSDICNTNLVALLTALIEEQTEPEWRQRAVRKPAIP